MRTSPTGLQHTLTYTAHHQPVCPGCQQGWHYLWVLSFHQRVQEEQYLSHTCQLQHQLRSSLHQT